MAVRAGGRSRIDRAPLGVLIYPVPVKSVFWFLWALFVLQMVAYAVRRWVPGMARPVLVGLLLASVAVFLLRVDPGSAVTIVENAPYFLLGVLLSGARRHLIPRGMMGLMAALALFLLAEALRFRDGGDAPWFQLVALLAVLGFAGAVGWIGGAVGGVLAWLGTRTMPIYLVHIIVTAATRVMLLKLGVSGVGLHLVLGTVLGVALPLVLDAVVQRLRLGALAGFGQRRG